MVLLILARGTSFDSVWRETRHRRSLPRDPEYQPTLFRGQNILVHAEAINISYLII